MKHYLTVNPNPETHCTKVTRTQTVRYSDKLSRVQTNFQTLELLCKPYFNLCKVSIFILKQ
jgi:hypothetical protein